MGNISDSYLLAHATEMRLVLAVLVCVTSFALIKIVDFVATSAQSLVSNAAAKGSRASDLDAATAR